MRSGSFRTLQTRAVAIRSLSIFVFSVLSGCRATTENVVTSKRNDHSSRLLGRPNRTGHRADRGMIRLSIIQRPNPTRQDCCVVHFNPTSKLGFPPSQIRFPFCRK